MLSFLDWFLFVMVVYLLSMGVISWRIHRLHLFSGDSVFLGGIISLAALGVSTLFLAIGLWLYIVWPLPNIVLGSFLTGAALILLLFISTALRVKGKKDLTHQAVSSFAGIFFSIEMIVFTAAIALV